jgi:hypothetical protein
MFQKRIIISSSQSYETLLKAFPHRKVEPTIWAPNGWFYWFGNRGAVRMMQTDDPKVWVLDYDRGYLHIKVRRILKKRV